MFFIRADANEVIGTGHVMRCLSIAEEIKRRGEETTFITADKYSEQMIASRGFLVICLQSIWNDLNQEIDILVQVIKSQQISLLLIDSYFVTERYLSEIEKYTKVAYIDDLDSFLYPVDYLINYNMYAEQLNYPIRYAAAGYKTRFFLGCSYVPLRKEFMNIKRVIRPHVEKVLITSGGTDYYNITGCILEKLSHQLWMQRVQFDVILGMFNCYKADLEKKWMKYKNIHLLNNVSNISDYMKECDIAITAGGVTTYELCAYGLPSIMYTLADNQLEIARTVSDRKIMPWVGDIRENMQDCLEKIIQNVNWYMEDFDERRYRSMRMQEVVDGKGCERLAEILCER